MHIINSLKNNIFVLLKSPKFLFYKIYYYLIFKKFFNKKVNCLLNINGCKITIPNDIVPFVVLEEVFIYEVYKNLENLKCVLDLGGFLGESAVYLAINNNQKVVTFEPDPENFKYLVKNVTQFNNIEYYNFAVINKEDKEEQDSNELIYYKSNEFDYGGNLYGMYGNERKIKIKTIGIDEIISKYKFDGIKMDIEGGEYEIIRWFLNNEKYFTFKKGYIEFHFEGKNEKNWRTFNSFIDFLALKNYRVEIKQNNELVSIDNIIEKYERLKNKQWLIFILYFERGDNYENNKR